MKFDSEVRELFNSQSQANPNSLVNFIIKSQVTVQAVGLDPEDEILFEMFYLASGTNPEVCDCFVLPGSMPTVQGAAPLMCDTCDDRQERLPVRLTLENPVVILTAPQGTIIRGVYRGPGLGSSRVWLTTNTDTQDLTPAMQGCPSLCMMPDGTFCQPDPESWQETGTRRCNLETDKLEALMVDNCGNEEWQELGDLRWVETGEIKCGELTQIGEHLGYYISRQEVNDCGDLRWVQDDTPSGPVFTGQIRYEKENDRCIEYREFTTECCCDTPIGLENGEAEYQPTGEYRCEGLSEYEGGIAFLKYEKYINPCGESRWQQLNYGEAGAWHPAHSTGLEQCRDVFPDGSEYPESWVFAQYKDDCGNTDWFQDRLAKWSETGEKKCEIVPGTEDSPEYHLFLQEVNDCGELRWVTSGESKDMIPTGKKRCRVEQLDGEGWFEFPEIELASECCCSETVWLAEDAIELQPTGVVECVDFHNASGEIDTFAYIRRVQLTSACGDIRWAESLETAKVTGRARAVEYDFEFSAEGREGLVQIEVRGDCPDCQSHWLPSLEQAVHWMPTGQTVCKTGEQWTVEVNQFGDTRYSGPGQSCGHMATLKLPNGCMAFRPGQQPDDATAVLKDCEDNVLGYLFAEPRADAQCEVMAGCDCDSTQVIGYGKHGRCGGLEDTFGELLGV